MLSILIPVYNVDVTKLVNSLFKQCSRHKIRFEILVYDDCSDEKYKEKNKPLSSLFGVNYLELQENLGRSKIRNWLVKSAIYERVLFLDSDSKLVGKSFIKEYLKVIDDADVIVGGRIYSKKPPRAKSKYLHWLYGSKKESKRAKVRNKNSANYFHTNNFLANRSIFDQVKFNEDIVGYGYEDLAFGHIIKKCDMSILHIDNPVEHIGLETNKVFLKKAENAIRNLIEYEREGILTDTRLQRFAHQIKAMGIQDIVYQQLEKRVEKYRDNLLKNEGKLYQFSLWKLYLYLGGSSAEA